MKLLVLLVAAVVLAGCSSSSGSPSTSSSAPTHPADAATTAAVRKAFTVFFDYRSTTAQSQAVLQHGARFVTTLRQQAASSYAQRSSATVSSVRLESADVADVTFSVSSNGSTPLKDAPGNAVREKGTWKVSAATFCQLVTLEGDAPKACGDPAVLQLPK